MVESVSSDDGPKRVLSILQPGYLPYSGFFELMARCDVFVIYDDVQYDKNSWRNRNRIRGPKGPVWLTVPVKVKGRFGQKINEVEIDNSSKWAKKHLGTIRQHYGSAPHFGDYLPFLESVLTREWRLLIDLDMAVIDHLRCLLGITCPVVYSSSLKSGGHKTDRVISICRELDVDAYLSTNGARDYICESAFAEAGIAFAYQDYSPPEYPQALPGFVSHLSALDLLMNIGPGSMIALLSTSRCPFAHPNIWRGCSASGGEQVG